MLHWALFLFIVSLVASYQGHNELAQITNSVSIYLLVVFFGLIVFSFILDHLLRPSRRR